MSHDHTHFPINTTATTASGQLLPQAASSGATTENSDSMVIDRLTSSAATRRHLRVPVEETHENTNGCPTNGSTDHPRNTYTIESRISMSSDTTELSDSSTPPLSNTNSLRKIYRVAKQNINLPVTLTDHASHNTSYFQYLTVDRASNPHSHIPYFVPGLLYDKPYKRPFD